jgi:hypothetical protein
MTGDASDSAAVDVPDGRDATVGQDAEAGPGPDADGGAAPDAAAEAGSDVISPGPDARDAQANSDAGDSADGQDTGDGADASFDGPFDGSDGQPSDAVDAAEQDASARLFDARGGACTCGMATSPSPLAAFWSVSLAALLLGWRPRRR